jgi:hypothetical protein
MASDESEQHTQKDLSAIYIALISHILCAGNNSYGHEAHDLLPIRQPESHLYTLCLIAERESRGSIGPHASPAQDLQISSPNHFQAQRFEN